MKSRDSEQRALPERAPVRMRLRCYRWLAVVLFVCAVTLLGAAALYGQVSTTPKAWAIPALPGQVGNEATSYFSATGPVPDMRPSVPTIAPRASTQPVGRTDGNARAVVKVDSSWGVPDLRMFGLSGAEAVGGGIFVLEAEGGDLGLAAALETVRRLPGVAWAEESVRRSACLVPNDPFYLSGCGVGQWGLQRIGLPAAWDVETGSEKVVVAILDTGINKDLADFAGRIVSPYCALDGIPEEMRTQWPSWCDNKGHGTAVAGVAVAQGNDGVGMAGAAWNVKIMPVKIDDGDGTWDYTLAKGLRWAVDHGADVINISFAGDRVTNVEAEAVAYAVDRGATVVAAAGNQASSYIYYPAALPGVIAVGATTHGDTRASYSARGLDLDLVAPGNDIVTYGIGSMSPTLWAGTSFSSPLVAGVAALLYSAQPELTSSQVTDILVESADDLGPAGWDHEFGWGLVDADEAVALAAQTSATTTSTVPSTTTTSGTTTTTVPSTTTSTAVPGSTTTTTTTDTQPGTSRFDDVSPETSPYSEQIEHLAALGIVTGTSDGLFHPRDTLRRQQFAKMIVRTLGYPVSQDDVCPFGDVAKVKGDLYPYHYVAVAWLRGITQGTTKVHFSPYRALSRAQLITMIARSVALPEPPSDYVAPFRNFSAVHFPYARRAAYAGLLDVLVGMGREYDFLAEASREEVCALLCRLL